ncbi:MAG TPA: hypothetical protein PKL31_09725 [Fulvivirga sp.]|nr:hypothetical protein [Fulvivirga sp.]
MANEEEDKKLIGRLINQRKKENDAFIKLLNAMEVKMDPHQSKSKEKKSKK